MVEKGGKMIKINEGIEGVSLNYRDQKDSPAQSISYDSRFHEQKQFFPVIGTPCRDRSGVGRENTDRTMSVVRGTASSGGLSSET